MRFVLARRARYIASFAFVIVALAACGGASSTSPSGNGVVASVTVSPTTLNLHPGEKGTLTATAFSSSGAVLTGKTFAWQSSNTSVANVSASGVVTAVTVGSAQISVTSEAYSANAAVIVTPGAATSTATLSTITF